MSMVKLMRGKPVTGSRDGPHRVGSPDGRVAFRPGSYERKGSLVLALSEEYGRVFGIAQLDVHRLQSPLSSDMDTTCRITAIVVIIVT